MMAEIAVAVPEHGDRHDDFNVRWLSVVKQADDLGGDVKSSFVATVSTANNLAVSDMTPRSILSCRTRSGMMSAGLERGS